MEVVVVVQVVVQVVAAAVDVMGAGAGAVAAAAAMAVAVVAVVVVVVVVMAVVVVGTPSDCKVSISMRQTSPLKRARHTTERYKDKARNGQTQAKRRPNTTAQMKICARDHFLQPHFSPV